MPVNSFVPIPDKVCAGYETSLFLASTTALPQEYSPRNGPVENPGIPSGLIFVFTLTLVI